VGGWQAKVRNKSQDFTSTMIEGRLTTLKALDKDGDAKSSNNQIRFRNFVAIKVYQNCFDKAKYDVLVCCKNIGILEYFDIDIPVMVYNELNCLQGKSRRNKQNLCF